MKILRLAGILFIPLIWLLSTDVFKIVNPILLPTFENTINRLFQLITSESFNSDLSHSLYRWTLGFLIGALVGIPLGLFLGISKSLNQFFDFPLEFIRTMPVTAIFPLFLILFGIGDAPKIAMSFLPTCLLLTVNSSYGVTFSESTRRKMAQVFGASRLQIFINIILPDSLPHIFIGLRLALAQSFIVTIVSEMFIGTDFGLGQRAYDSYLTNSTPTLYAILIIIGTIGFFANKIFCSLETKLVYWAGK